MKRSYNYLVYIGRFQPFHNGHKYIIDMALSKANKVIMLCGTGGLTEKNPWSFAQVKEMILRCYSDDQIEIIEVRDNASDDVWIKDIRLIIEKNTTGRVGIIGHHKDRSSYYLDKVCKFYEYIEVENFQGINATDIRKLLSANKLHLVKSLVPQQVFNYICSLSCT